MKKPAPFDPRDLMPVSPVVAHITNDLFVSQPTLAQLPEVQLALLGVMARYIDHLRGLDVHAPDVTAADQRRALLFLQNTARPVHGAPDRTAADLVADALETIRVRRGAASIASARAFEQAIARIVEVVRREIVRRADARSARICF